jgi:hypothetical protein
MQKLLTYILVIDNSEPYGNTIITIIAILTVFQLVRDIFKEKK